MIPSHDSLEGLLKPHDNWSTIIERFMVKVNVSDSASDIGFGVELNIELILDKSIDMFQTPTKLVDNTIKTVLCNHVTGKTLTFP